MWLQLPELERQNAKIDYFTRLRNLGAIMDHRLNWKKHCEVLKGKALRSLTAVKPSSTFASLPKGKNKTIQKLHLARDDQRLCGVGFHI